MSAQIIDISSKITNSQPVVKITEDLVVTVNNRKSNILAIKLMTDEMQRKAKNKKKVIDLDESGNVLPDEYDELAFMTKILGMLITKKNADAIEKMDLPFPEYKTLYETIMAVATGTYGETPTK